jgi:DNA polymerase (family X)
VGKSGKATPLEKAERVAQWTAENLWVSPEVLDVVVCGSVRRGADTVFDVDLLVVTDMPSLEFLSGEFPLAHWTPSTGVWLVDDVRVELWRCPPESLGARAVFLTGPASLNIFMRRRAIRRGLMLSQYGLRERVGGERLDKSTGDVDRDEAEIFRLLEMPMMEPADRTHWWDAMHPGQAHEVPNA